MCSLYLYTHTHVHDHTVHPAITVSFTQSLRFWHPTQLLSPPPLFSVVSEHYISVLAHCVCMFLAFVLLLCVCVCVCVFMCTRAWEIFLEMEWNQCSEDKLMLYHVGDVLGCRLTGVGGEVGKKRCRRWLFSYINIFLFILLGILFIDPKHVHKTKHKSKSPNVLKVLTNTRQTRQTKLYSWI